MTTGRDPVQRAVARRAGAGFFFAFEASAASMVLPQLYLAGQPGNRQFVLSALLTTGAAVGFAAILGSRHLLARGRSLSATSFRLWLAVVVVALMPVLFRAPLVAYIGCFVLFRGMSDGLFNHLDATLVTAAGPRGAATHVRVWVVALLLGGIVGPPVAALAFATPPLLCAAFVAIAAHMAWAVHGGLHNRAEPVPSPGPRAPMPPGARGFLAASLVYQAASWSMISQLLFFVATLVPPDELDSTGAVVATCANVAAALVAALAGRRTGSPARALLFPCLVSATAMGVAAMAQSVPAVIAAGLLAGGAWGAFLLLARRVVVAFDDGRADAPALSAYNNLGNLGQLIGFGGTTLLAAVLPTERFFDGLFIALGVSFLAAAAAFVAAGSVAASPVAAGRRPPTTRRTTE